MFFLQNLVWGAQVILLSGHMAALGFSGQQISYVAATSSLGGDLLAPDRRLVGRSLFAGANLRWNLLPALCAAAVLGVAADGIYAALGGDVRLCHAAHADGRCDQRDCFQTSTRHAFVWPSAGVGQYRLGGH